MVEKGDTAEGARVASVGVPNIGFDISLIPPQSASYNPISHCFKVFNGLFLPHHAPFNHINFGTIAIWFFLC
jgi:hypothetical protein|tara:strand:+ start:198 stop:413 length:216 start_codon:yes stop_codon:yes gene_type:complete